jgi:hypothetical protein
MRVGWECSHSVIDDHSRLAYTELHPDEKAATVVVVVAAAATAGQSSSIGADEISTITRAGDCWT